MLNRQQQKSQPELSQLGTTNGNLLKTNGDALSEVDVTPEMVEDVSPELVEDVSPEMDVPPKLDNSLELSAIGLPNALNQAAA